MTSVLQLSQPGPGAQRSVALRSVALDLGISTFIKNTHGSQMLQNG
jgi:hypothetical protein